MRKVNEIKEVRNMEDVINFMGKIVHSKSYALYSNNDHLDEYQFYSKPNYQHLNEITSFLKDEEKNNKVILLGFNNDYKIRYIF